jgi:type 1 glutamine amidotransferase
MSIMLDRRALIALLGAATAGSLAARAQPRRSRILYFTHSAGYRHEAIELSHAILKQVGENSGMFDVASSEDVSEFTVENLTRYDTVMFYTTGELPMSSAQKAAFLGFVRSGRGFVGVHSATDTYYEWPDYLELIGGYFDGHPWHQSVRINVADWSSALVSHFGPSLEIHDEIYQIRDFDERGSRVLLRLDPSSVDLTRDGVHRRPYGWPLAWTRSYGAGRVFYTALGHEAGVWRDTRYQRMLLNAILWAAGHTTAVQ